MAFNYDCPDLATVVQSIRRGEFTVSDLINRTCEKHETHGSKLNAYRHWDGETARHEADKLDGVSTSALAARPLHGIPISVKDLFGQSGAETYAGSPKRLPARWEGDGPFVKACREAGAVFVGRTNMVEFAFGALGVNSHWPTPRNPWDKKSHRVAGGSSSGAGVSLIEGSALVALGSDTAGSVRIPASVTGTIGFKPTKGRWSTEGIVPLSTSFDTPGLLTRSVRDLAYVFDALDPVLTGGEKSQDCSPVDLNHVTFGSCDKHFWDNCSPGICEAVEDAIRHLEAAGLKIKSIELPEIDDAYAIFKDGGLAASEFRHFLMSELPDWMDSLDPRIAARLDVGPIMGTPAYAERKNRLIVMATRANEIFSRIDVLVSPTVPLTAPKVTELIETSAYSKANITILQNTFAANLLNFCALTLPVGKDAEGVPVGLQLMAAAGNDRYLVQVGLSVERMLGVTIK